MCRPRMFTEGTHGEETTDAASYSQKLAITRFPTRGQDLQSFLEQIAYDNHASLLQLVKAIGIPRKARPFGFLDDEHLPLATIAEALSCRSDDIRAMTFAPFMSLTWLTTHRGYGQYAATDPPSLLNLWKRVLRQPGSRFCPLCLIERDGAWKTRWFFTIDVVCLRHLVLLECHCPTCGKTPHSGENRFRSNPAAPTRCVHHDPRWVKTDAQLRASLCGSDLSAVTPIALEMDHPIVRTQRLVDRVSGLVGATENVMLCGKSVPAPEALTGIVILALRFAMQRLDFTTAVSSEISPGRHLTVGVRYRFVDHAASPGPVFGCQDSTAEFGTLMAAAADVLSARDFYSAANVMERYYDLGRDFSTPSQPAEDTPDKYGSYCTGVFVRKNRVNSGLVDSVELARRDEHFTPAQKLSYRCITEFPRRPGDFEWPHLPGESHRLNSENLPQSMWPEAAGLLPTLTTKDSGAMNISASMLLARIGTHDKWSAIAQRFLLSRSSARTISVHLTRLQKAGLYDDMVKALDALWEDLVADPPPIDYDRRRWEFLVRPEPSPELMGFLHLQGKKRQRRHVSIRMWERLTGGDARFHVTMDPLRAGADRYEYKKFLLGLSAKDSELIDDECRRILEDRAIAEPLRWFPYTLDTYDPPSANMTEIDVGGGTIRPWADRPGYYLETPITMYSHGGCVRGHILARCATILSEEANSDGMCRVELLQARNVRDDSLNIPTEAAFADQLIRGAAIRMGVAPDDLTRQVVNVLCRIEFNNAEWNKLLTSNGEPMAFSFKERRINS